MGLSLWSVVASFTCLLGLLNTAWALNCYQCNSSFDYNCQEMFDHDTANNPLTPTNCNQGDPYLFEAKYCIKTIGIWGGVAGTHRFCSAKDLGNQCQYIVYPDHDRVYQACVFTCTNDDCNSTPVLTRLSLPLLILTALAVYFLR